MVTRSGAGGNMPPAVGVITDRVIAKRPDLEGMMGFCGGGNRHIWIEVALHDESCRRRFDSGMRA